VSTIAARPAIADVSKHPGAWDAALHQVFYLFQSRHGAAGGDDRRHVLTHRERVGVKRQKIGRPVDRNRATRPRSRTCRAGAASDMWQPTLAHYLTLAAIPLHHRDFRHFLNRKNVIIILMSVELMLLLGQPQPGRVLALLNDMWAGLRPCWS